MNVKKEVWLLLAVFVLPIVLGTVFFYWNPSYFTNSTVNYGQLIDPIITITEEDVVFSTAKVDSIKSLWTLAYAVNSCDASCYKTIKNLKTIRILMNKNMRRIQYILLTNNDIDTKELNFIARPSVALAKKIADFPMNTIFLIDPIGNMVLYYKAYGLDIKRVVKDLERLFKYSRIG